MARPPSCPYISRQQINVLAPDDSAQGPVSGVVTNHGAVSAPFAAQLQPTAPGLFQLGATTYPVVARYPDNALIGNAGRDGRPSRRASCFPTCPVYPLVVVW